ncbi:MAG: type II toxin-antitoxin system RelE/ParE family toxin [Minicystis sp.]
MAGPERPVVWTRLADRDLEQDFAYLRERSPQTAQRFAADIFAAVEKLERHPELGPIARDITPIGRYRHLPVGRHRILYRIDDGTLLILRVWDTRRDPDELEPGQ